MHLIQFTLTLLVSYAIVLLVIQLTLKRSITPTVTVYFLDRVNVIVIFTGNPQCYCITRNGFCQLNNNCYENNY